MLNDDFTNISSYYTRCQLSDAASKLTSNLPKWVRICILDKNHEFYHSYNKPKFINTCFIDYLLLSIWICQKINQYTIKILEEKFNSHNQLIANILKTFKYIDQKEWNKAKSVWMVDVCKMNPDKDMHFVLLW